MELLYVWVEDYKCLKNQGFNFSPKHRFKFDYKNSTLQYSQNSNVDEGFFNYTKRDNNSGQIKNITTIVGINGVGKSTLLELIRDNITSSKLGIKAGNMFIFKYMNCFQVYYSCEYNTPSNIKLETDEVYYELFNSFEKGYASNELYYDFDEYSHEPDSGYLRCDQWEDCDDIRYLKFVNYSNYFDANQYLNIDKLNSGDNCYDISTSALIESEGLENDNLINIENKLGHDKNSRFFYKEYFRQISLISKHKECNKYIPFSLPKEFNISFKNLGNIKNKIECAVKDRFKFKIEEDNQQLKNFYDKLLNKCFYEKSKLNKDKHNKDMNIFSFKLLEGILITFLYEVICYPFRLLSFDVIEKMSKAPLEEIFGNNNLHHCIMKFFEFLSDSSDSKDQYYAVDQYISNIIEFLKEFNKYQELDKLKIFKKNILNDDEFSISLKDNDENEEIKRFLSSYRETIISFNYLNFSWNLSSGENHLLNMLSRFFSLTIGDKQFLPRDNSNIPQDVIILIDEGEIGLHPKWQQQYIKLITTFLSDIYKGSSLQLIITTHSPIILSDIPSSNIIYIDKDNKGIVKVKDGNEFEETFAQNIHTLYANSFFLSEGFLGKFATDKLKNIIEEIQAEDKIDEEKVLEIRRNIEIIGEPIIKNRLKRMLEEKIASTSNYLEKRISELELEIENLRSKVDRSND